MGDSTHNTLNTSWVLWFHNPQDMNWEINSYKMIKKIDSIIDFWSVYNLLTDKIVENSMLFLMKDGINPLWEDEQNKEGGSWSFKYQKGNLSKNWTNFSINLLGEQLVEDVHSKLINGISISPKKNFCIIKIWLKNKKHTNIKIFRKIEDLKYDGGIFKSHK